jgi:hypothetical protein
MRVILAAFAVLAAAGCASGSESPAVHGTPVRLFVAGAVDLTGPAAVVAEADPEGLFREVRSMVRRADLAIVASANDEAAVVLARAGFDVVADPLQSAIRLMLPSLGSLLSGDPSATGSVLEILADTEGVVAYRVGRVAHDDLRVHFAGWNPPRGDAALIDGEWWTLLRMVTPAPVERPARDVPFEQGDLTAAAVGDVTGDGQPDVAASYRHPLRDSVVTEALPGVVPVDSRGRSAHLGVFTLEGEALWAAGLIPRPVGDLAACDRSVSLAYTGLDDPGVVATGAATWEGLSLWPAAELPGPGLPRCADVDGDGRLDPVILGRSL